MPQPQFILTSDGGSDERTSGAAACILRVPADDRRIKLIGMTGPLSGSQAELAAALIGWCAIAEYGAPPSNCTVHWLGDNEGLLSSATSIHDWKAKGWRTSADRPVANRGFWEAFIALSSNQIVSVEHIRGHAGHRENEACDRAARWIQRKGEKLLAAHGAGKIGQLARSAPDQAWALLDSREPIKLLLEGNDIQSAVDGMRAAVRPHVR